MMESQNQGNNESTDIPIVHKPIKRRDRAVSEMDHNEYVKQFGAPPAPLFKPLKSPSLKIESIELPPPCDVELNDKKQSLNFTKDLKLVQEIPEEEDYEDKCAEEIFPVPFKSFFGGSIFSTASKFSEKEHDDSSNKSSTMSSATRRSRSYSENITSCSILKFMDSRIQKK